MQNNYDIDSLVETFKEHAIKFKESQERQAQIFPIDQSPARIFNTFSLCEALVTICQEIQSLKAKL